MERKIGKNIILMILLIVFVLAGLPLISQAGEETTKSKKEKAPVENTKEKKATLKLVSGSGNKVGIDLTNTVPVRGMQFTVDGAKLTEVRTTSRTAGFLAKFNEENGVVIIVSVSEDEIAPGTGSIAEIIYQKAPGSTPAITLSGVKIVGRNKEAL